MKSTELHTLPIAPKPGYGTGGKNLHPFIVGLLDTLPEPASVWPKPDRQKWLQTAENIFSLIYQDEGETEGH